MRDWDWEDVKYEALAFLLAIVLPGAIIVIIGMALHEPSNSNTTKYYCGETITECELNLEADERERAMEEYYKEMEDEMYAERAADCAYYGWCD